MVAGLIKEYERLLAQFGQKKSDLMCLMSGHGYNKNLHYGEVRWRIEASCPACKKNFYDNLTCCDGWRDATIKFADQFYTTPCFSCGVRSKIHEVVKVTKHERA